MKKVTSSANANIALVKYWGKEDSIYNIPKVPSLSMTLDGLGTRTEVETSSSDELTIDNYPASKEAYNKYINFLNKARLLYDFKDKIKANTRNNIPYAAGLASSASSFAAMAAGINKLLNLGLDQKAVSALARLGSASAARSMFTGFAALEKEFAYGLVAHKNLKIMMTIVLVSKEKKALSSTKAMKITQNTSPLYQDFYEESFENFLRAKEALKTGDFPLLGKTMELSTIKMHASMGSSKPQIDFLQPLSLEVIKYIYKLREELGNIAYFTADAGPNIKILHEIQNKDIILNYIKINFPNIDITQSYPGIGAQCE